MFNFKEDCTDCQALCCIATCRDELGCNGPGEYMLGEPCPRLTENLRCSVHDILRTSALYAGCHNYTCKGAGMPLTKLLTVAGISDIRYPSNPRQHAITSVINMIFKYIEESLRVIENIIDVKERMYFEKKLSGLFTRFEKYITSGHEVYSMIPASMEVFAEHLWYQRKHVRNPAKIDPRRGQKVLFHAQYCIVPETFSVPADLFNTEVAKEFPGVRQAPKVFVRLVFATYQLGTAYFGYSHLWSSFDQEALKQEFVQAALDYSQVRKNVLARSVAEYVWQWCSECTYER